MSKDVRGIERWKCACDKCSGNSEAIRKFSDKYIVPDKLVAEYVVHLAQIRGRKRRLKGSE